MNYEINVALNGKHFFATHERSIRTESELRKVLEVFTQKFPKEEGYHISISHWEKRGKELNIEEILSK